MLKSRFFASGLIVLAAMLMTVSCEEGPEPRAELLPERFSVDIPTSISNSASAGRTQADTLNGNAIYLNLATFIAVGSGSAKLVEEIIGGIRKYALDRVETASFTSDDDSRKKNLVVTKDVSFEGATWQYMLIVTDAESEGNADGGKALQVYWNQGTPIHGVAVIKPYNCDRTHNGGIKDAVFRIDYDEQTETGYDAQMQVSISGLPLPVGETFAIRSLHMFAGKKGDVVEVYGNSNHPNAYFFTGQRGFNWAFVAAGSNEQNIGVAEVGLPPSTLDNSNRTVLLKDYSIQTVLTAQVQTAFPFLPASVIANYLKNTAAPGYFNSAGFVAGGKSPGAAWDALNNRLAALSPYNPKATAELSVQFGQ
jgi:hypothetical protein